MPSDPPLHVALGPDLRRPSVLLLKVINVDCCTGLLFQRVQIWQDNHVKIQERNTIGIV